MSSKEMTIRELPKEHFDKLTGIFEGVFDSDPPRPDHSRIFICHNDEGDPVGFVHCESVVLIGQLYVVPAERDNTMAIAKTVVTFCQENFDGKVNTATVASEPRFEKLFKSLGMQRVEGTFHRKNVDF